MDHGKPRHLMRTRMMIEILPMKPQSNIEHLPELMGKTTIECVKNLARNKIELMKHNNQRELK